MKILWIDLNSSYAHSSLALPALHAQIANDSSIEWAIVSATINENTGTVVDEAYRHKPDILAATTWLFNHEQLLHIVSRLKALLPETCLILGGPEFLGDNEFFLRKNPFVNCVFRGEGEEAFPQWLACWNHPEQWKDIPGLCYLDADKQYKDNDVSTHAPFASAAARNRFALSLLTASANGSESSMSMVLKMYAYSTVHSITMHVVQKNCSNCF